MLLTPFFDLDSLENSLRNATFFTLFFTMIVYWIDTTFYTPVNTSSYQGQPDPSLNRQATKGQGLLAHVLPTLSMTISNILLILLLLVRWEKSGHFPLSNLYESLMFLAWCCTFLYLIYSPLTIFKIAKPETKFLSSKERQLLPFKTAVQVHSSRGLLTNSSTSLFQNKIFGSIIAPCALLMNAFATFSLPKEMQQAAPLVPALQSNWLMMHVTVMIISYATLIIGSLLSILFLIAQRLNLNSIKSKARLDPLPDELGSPTLHKFDPGPLAPKSDNLSATQTISNNGHNNNWHSNGWSNSLRYLDLLSYRIIGLGFPFLTIGILSGAVWANEAWGSYWSWDPKETWALLTWLVFAIYLHTRLTKGWQGEKPAVIASIGFLIVWFCYLGVNLIGEGLHSYGFFKL
jgi:cytochrome c-type biogenesis protein CcsB